jgi:glycosyltransferase involved in cell wall biosynthesis
MFEAVARKAKRVICVSDFTAKEFCKYTDVDKNKIKVVHNGVDESWFNIKSNNIRPIKEPYYIYVGNIKPHKNLVRLINAYRLVKNRIKQKLVLVGKKDGFITGIDNINTLIKGLEDRIIFTGYLDDKTLQYYVVNADAMIFPSLYEGFGLPPLEAMACGCPVLASAIPPIKEVCCDNVQYFNPYDVRNIAHAMLLSEFGNLQRIAKNVEERYKWDSTVEQVTKIIESICTL